MAAGAGAAAVPPSTREAIEEIMRIYRSLPPRPSLEEVEAATAVLKASAAEEEAKLEEIGRLPRPPDLPEELFSVLQEVRRASALLRGVEERREAQRVAELDGRLAAFDEMIQRLSRMVSFFVDADGGETREETKKKGSLGGFVIPSSKLPVPPPEATQAHGGGNTYTDKLSLIKVASLIETSAKDGTGVLDLRGKLMDQIEWLPLSLGKLQHISELDLSENRIMALPQTIGDLRFLTKLDVHSNQLESLPESFGELSSLMDLDLHANRLNSLPASFGNLARLINLDLSSNQLSLLPDTLGSLTSLRKLNVETNNLEELPYTIGSCSSLVELRLDFNQLKALPEAIGKLEQLEVLTAHYNRIKGLPTTMGSLAKLRELDVSFNELESIPESLCFATSLVKLDVGRNFADLRSLPRSIGNLENLEVLDISSNQIRVLPESFRFLSKLRVFSSDETPLELLPREVIKLGAQAVVQYMADLVQSSQPAERRKGVWFWLCSLFRPRQKEDDSHLVCTEA
ncbi:plant intracellular Ras-group-related LRR protein 5-like isoform X1 [Iris pallida]|uniref:Plant intracellular Ras-group-related LRR protein 5-like isoform X1 n=1 Tax=Iris pallida TaxID=29817 RepID=A0AAX6HJE8_IRIPA|nr:plant intracellular Ras-group-related LRR protein 5-like isoform X1 [Iris pallida]